MSKDMTLRVLRIGCLVGVALSAGLSRRLIHVEAAAPPQLPHSAPGQPVSPSRALLDRYCVTCHNERLKTAGVMFDKVDINRVDAHRELFEKVVRKLRKGQMPPQSAPQPDQTSLTTFLTALEAELD